jgi:hypothetical protein
MVTWPSEIAIAGKKIVDYGDIDDNKCTVPKQGAPNPLWRAQVKDKGVV